MAFDLESQLRSLQGRTQCGCYVTGIAPDHSEPSYTPVTPTHVYGEEASSKALRFACAAEVIDTDGEVSSDGQRVYVTNASYALIAVQARTNYAGFQKERNNDVTQLLNGILAEIAAVRETGASAVRETGAGQSGEVCQESLQGQSGQKENDAFLYQVLLNAHLEDYRSLYDRVKIDLGKSFTGQLPTSERMAAAQTSWRLSRPIAGTILRIFSPCWSRIVSSIRV